MAVIYVDRSDRGKLRFSGEQDLWFLHQIMTQSFEDMKPGDARDAALLTAHGRMLGYLETLRTEDAIYAHFEASLLESLPELIRRYVFATRVEIDDVTQDFGLLAVVGEGWEDTVGVVEGALVHRTNAFGVPAAHLWLPAERVTEALERLEAAGASPAGESELEEMRVRHGIPRWGFDMDLKTIPQEVGAERWAVHFDKGCYVGQEAMAKIHFRGKVNRRLARLEGKGLVVGADVEAEGVKVGRVTSVVDGFGLAVVKHTVASGESVEVDGNLVKVTG